MKKKIKRIIHARQSWGGMCALKKMKNRERLGSENYRGKVAGTLVKGERRKKTQKEKKNKKRTGKCKRGAPGEVISLKSKRKAILMTEKALSVTLKRDTKQV